MPICSGQLGHGCRESVNEPDNTIPGLTGHDKPLVGIGSSMALKRLLLIISIGILMLLPAQGARADYPPHQETDKPPFRLPFSEPPGPSTWLVVQFYGNTQGAYRWRNKWYEAGQGLHFGVDFSAPCGTEVLAIGDGEVAKIDASEHGAGPHNLVILHHNGYISLYGHLLNAPLLYIGQPVEAGQVIGLSGDPDLSCASRPHLHLEIRDDSYHYAYNPIPLIDADWDTLALLGPFSGFERDLDHPRRWVSPYDQPDVDFWGPMLNEYERPWPPDWY